MEDLQASNSLQGEGKKVEISSWVAELFFYCDSEYFCHMQGVKNGRSSTF